MAILYRFGQFVLDPAKRTLSRADSPIFLTPKALDVLIFLAQNPNRLVTKEELLRAVWGDTFVEEGNLTQYISHLRKALADNSEDGRLIVTIARKGYQFTGDVSVGEAADVVEASKYSRKAVGVLVAASAVILIASGYISWRHFRDVIPPQSKKVMLAVLPFENLTGDPKKEYIAEGLTEETISQLGRLDPQHLGVIARTSVMGYEHSEERLDQIGHDLSVQYVLENSLRENGSRLRLTAQLIQVKDQTHLWSQDYDYSMKDILTVEDDVARSVAQEIRLRLGPEKQAQLAQPQPVNPEAFDAYLQGYYYFQRNTDQDVGTAEKYFERATQLDPNYALAWAWLSRARNWQAVRGLMPAEEGERLAHEAVERALALNPNLAEAHSEMWRLKRYSDFDWVGANASIQRAIALDPGDSEYLTEAAYSAVTSGHLDDAVRLARRAVELDPLNAGSWGGVGAMSYYDGQLAEAEADLKKSLKLGPDLWFGHSLLSQIYVMEGRPQDALGEVAQERYEPSRLQDLAIAYYALGRKKESDAALKELIAKYSTNAYGIAMVYAFQNQRDEAFEWLDRAYAQGDASVVSAKVYPLLKNLHNDPRFAAFLKKLNLPN